MTTVEQPDEVTDSSGNVFEDIGVPMNEDDMLKVEIARAISRAVQDRSLTQVRAAEIMQTDQPKVSRILRGLLDGFALEWLLHRLTLLGCNVDIRVGKVRKAGGARIKVLT